MKSCDSLNVDATSPISVASTSGFSDISAINEFRFFGSAGVFQLTVNLRKTKINLRFNLLRGIRRRKQHLVKKHHLKDNNNGFYHYTYSSYKQLNKSLSG